MSSVFQFLSQKRETVNSKKSRKQSGQSARHLLFEPLEERQMLSITQFPSGWADSVDLQIRYWVMNDSRTVMEGFLLGVDNDKVTLKHGNGGEQVYTFKDFSLADQHYLETLANDSALLEIALERSELQQEMFLDDFTNSNVGQSGLPDLDVLYISRTPGSLSLHGMVEYVDGVPSLSLAGQTIESFDIAPGTLTTFTAHIANYGGTASGSFEGQWYIDCVPVGSVITCDSLLVGGKTNVSLDWLWEDGSHTVTFRIDPNNLIEETVKVNNERTDAIQGAGFVVAMAQDFYDSFRANANMIGSKSPEDWIQWHMDDMNRKFAEAIYPASPDGCHFRVRIDQLLVVPNRDAGWEAVKVYADISQGNWAIDGTYKNIWTQPDWGLIHEWGHQLGLIDDYNLDIDIVRSTQLGLIDANGQLLSLEYLFPDGDTMMCAHGANPFHELTAAALNHQINENGQQTPRGFYGDYLFNFCDSYSIQFNDRNGKPLSNAEVGIYVSGDDQVYSSIPTFLLQTNQTGVINIPNRKSPITTTTSGFTSQDNPFGRINVVGSNGVMLIQVKYDGQEAYYLLNITEFVIPAYLGETEHTFGIPTFFSNDTSIIPPANLSGEYISRTELRLSFDVFLGQSIREYRVYMKTSINDDRSDNWKLVSSIMPTSGKTHYSTAGIQVADNKYEASFIVIAVDSSGKESRFSQKYVMPLVVIPTGIVEAPDGTLFVSDGHHVNVSAFYNTLPGLHWNFDGSNDRYGHILGLAIDANIDDSVSYRLIATNISQHKIMFIGPNGENLGEFGREGSRSGEFRNPMDVAIGPDGNIYVADTGNRRIQVFSPYGDFLAVFGNNDLLRPEKLAIDKNGLIYVSDREKNKILVFQNGQLVNTIGNSDLKLPGAISIRKDGLIAVSNNDKWTVDFYSPDGIKLKSIYVPDFDHRGLVFGSTFLANGDFLAINEYSGGNFFTIAASPQNFQLTKSTDSIALSWDEVEFTSAYRIEWSETGIEGSWNTIQELDLQTLSFVKNNPSAGYYRIGAKGLDGTYFYSSVIGYDASQILTVTADRASINEGVNKGINFTVTRTGDLSEPLVVNLVSSHPGLFAVPHQITIPVGKNSMIFSGSSMLDYASSADQKVAVSASAAGFLAKDANITVINVLTAATPLGSDDKTLFYLNGDGTTQANNGTTPTASSGITFVDGIARQGIHIGPQGNIQYLAENNVNVKNGTIEFWYQPDYDTRDFNINRNFITVGLAHDHRNTMEITIDGAHNLVSYFNNGTNVVGVGTSTNDFIAGRWYSIALTWSESGVSLYINGVLKSTNTQKPGLEKFGYNSPAIITIGGYYDGNQGISGTIDDFRISSVARSAWEIAADYRKGLTIPEPEAPATPEGLQVAGATTKTIHLTWKPVANATMYRILRSESSASGYKEIVCLSETNLIDSNLISDKNYYYKVVAINGVGESLPSQFTRGKTEYEIISAPAIPANFRCTVKTSNSVTLAWDTSARATSYILQYKKTTDAEWVNVFLSTETSATITGLTVGTDYNFRVQATNSIGSSGWVTISVITDQTKLSTPTLGNVTAMGSSTIGVAWNAVTNASGYVIQYAADDKFTVGVGTITVSSQSTTSVNLTGLNANTTYYVRVMATGTGAYSDSDYSVAKSATTNKVKLDTPMIGNVTATSSSVINVTWNTMVNVSSYVIQYAIDDKFTTGVGTITVNSQSTTSANLVGLRANTTYYVRIMAMGIDNYNDSDYSAAKSATTHKIKLTTPVLGNVTATDSNTISVAWNAVPNANGYVIQYATNSAFTASVGTVVVDSQSTTSANLTGLNANTTYYVRVMATGAGNYSDSDYSTVKSATTHKIKLAEPMLNIVTATSNNTINVTWNAMTNANGYMIQYATNSAFSSGVGTVAIDSQSTTSANLTGLNANTTYYVRIMATGTGAYSDSDYSAAKSATTYKIKLATPTLGNVTATDSSTISVAWNTVTNANGYVIQYATNTAFTAGVASMTVSSQSTTSVNLTGLNANTTYYVRIVATGTGDYSESDYSTTKSATTHKAKLAAPALGNVAATSNNTISVAWNVVSNANGYRVEYATTDTFADKKSVSVTVTSTTLTELNANTTYYVRVMATGAGNYSDSDYSAVKNAKTNPLDGLTMPQDGISHEWMVRKSQTDNNKLEVVDLKNSVIVDSWSLGGLDRLIVNSSGMANDSLTMDFSNGAFLLDKGVQFIGHANTCETLLFIGTNGDDSVVLDGAKKYFNDLLIDTQNVEQFILDGGKGNDQAFVVGSDSGNTFNMSDNLLVMDCGGYRVKLGNFNKINAFADGMRDKTYVCGQNNSLIFMNDQYVERRSEGQSYRIWRSEQVIAINMDDTNNAIMHSGSRAFDRYTIAENYGAATNANGSYYHEWIDFALVNISSRNASVNLSGKTDGATWTPLDDRKIWQQNDTSVTIFGNANVSIRGIPFETSQSLSLELLPDDTITQSLLSLQAMIETPVATTQNDMTTVPVWSYVSTQTATDQQIVPNMDLLSPIQLSGVNTQSTAVASTDEAQLSVHDTVLIQNRDLYYLSWVEEQQQTDKKKRSEIFDDINWLEDFEELAQRELKK